VSERPRILVADPIAEEGLALLRARAEVEVRPGLDPEHLARAVAEADALIVRSQTRVTAAALAAGRRLKVVARAGTGIDNIDVAAATERGILVVNAPGGNAVAAAEHTIGLLFALARRIPAADAALKRGEWRRDDLVGIEVAGKILGLVGLGWVGREVAQRALGLGLRVLAHDPYVPSEHLERLGLEPVGLEELLERADFVSLHVPLTEATRGLIGRRELARMHPHAFLINCARGELVDEAALLEALEDNRLAGAALDVFSREPATDNPLAHHPRVVATPHLGASTHEAQANVARQVAEQVLDVLAGRAAQYVVNAPALPPEQAHALQPYLRLAEILGSMCTQLADGQLERAIVEFRGELAEHDTAALAAAAIKGLLAPISDAPITAVNARLVAERRGLQVVELKSSASPDYTSLVAVALEGRSGRRSVAGTILEGVPHVIGIDEYGLHFVPEPGYLLVTRHRDQPGVVGTVGTILGELDVNISQMQVGRSRPRGDALMLLAVDEPISPQAAARLKALPNVGQLRVIRL
jgi:D-3-phosphoglycerate dehydrogenase